MKRIFHDPHRNFCIGLILHIQLCRSALSPGSGDRSLSVWHDPIDVTCNAPSNWDHSIGMWLEYLSQSIRLYTLPLLFYPPVWPVLLTGYGYRKGIIGRADLLAISGLACLFPLPAVLLSLFGLELWRRFWVRRQHGDIPALPGLFIGLIAYLLLRLFLQSP